MTCNGFISPTIFSGTNTMVQMFYQLSGGTLNDGTGLPMSIAFRVPDSIDVSILADNDAGKCLAGVITGAGNARLMQNAVQVEGELYAFLTGKDPEKAQTADVIAAFQGAKGKVITKQDIIKAYCGADAKDECDAARLGAQPLVAYLGSMKVVTDPSYETRKQKQDAAIDRAKKEVGEENGPLNDKIKTLTQEDAAAHTQFNLLMATTFGFGSLSLVLGLVTVLARRGTGMKAIHPDAKRAIQREALVDDGIPKQSAAHPKSEPKIEPVTSPAPVRTLTRAVADHPATPSPTPANPSRTFLAADGDVADLAAALMAAGQNKSPLPDASPSEPPATTGLPADNVIIRGPDAKPSAELSKVVVMAEISYFYPKFLTRDHASIHPDSRASVKQLAELAMQAFAHRDANAPTPTELWRIEESGRGSMIGGGLPEKWLREFVNRQLEKWHEANAPGSFDASTREEMERDAERRAGERSSYEKWVGDFLSDPSKR